MIKILPLIQEVASNEDQQDIIASCIEGDEGAYKILYDLYADALYNTGFRILNNQAEAEDAVQEAFVDAFTNISGFQNRSSFGTWIKRILIHKCINLVKKKKLSTIELKEIHMDNTPQETTGSDDEIQWEVNKILKGIGLLPGNYRMVVSLYLLEGYDHEEISGIVQLPVATIRTQYVRGKKKLLDILKNESPT